MIIKAPLQCCFWLSRIKVSLIASVTRGVVLVLIRLTRRAEGKSLLFLCLFFPSAVFRNQVDRNNISHNNVNLGPTKCEAWPCRETRNRNEWNKSVGSSRHARANCFLDRLWRKLRRASLQVSPKQRKGNNMLHKVCFHKASHRGIFSLATDTSPTHKAAVDWVVKCASANSSAIKPNTWWGRWERGVKLISLLIGPCKALLITPDPDRLLPPVQNVLLHLTEIQRKGEKLSHHATDKNTSAVHPSAISIFLFLSRYPSRTVWLQLLC